MSALGLGAYGSDEETEEQQEDDVAAGLLQGDGTAAAGPSGARDHSEEAAGEGQGGAQSFSAAPEVGSMDVDAPQTSGAADEAMGEGDGATPGGGGDVWSSLPPELRDAPPGSCSPEVEAKLHSMIATMRKQQHRFIDSLRKNRQYSNPNLLQQLVQIYGLCESGTAFPPDVFSLDALPKEDSADQLLAQLERQQEARRQQRSDARPGQASIPFERGTGALGVVNPSAPGDSKGGPAGTAALVKAAALAAQQAAAGADGRGVAGGAGAGLLNVAQLREQAERNAAAMMANVGKRSKWDSGK